VLTAYIIWNKENNKLVVGIKFQLKIVKFNLILILINSYQNYVEYQPLLLLDLSFE